MLLKSADDKSKRLALLEDLQKSPYLDFQQKKWLREELQRCKKGIQGERESAHYLDSYFKDGENHVVLHDLRFVLDGDVAQIEDSGSTGNLRAARQASRLSPCCDDASQGDHQTSRTSGV